MRTVPTSIQNHLEQDTASTAICWKITLKDGSVIRGTDHDDDISIAAVSPSNGLDGATYIAGANISMSDLASSADLSVNNAEVNGAFPTSVFVEDLTPQIIESGIADLAPVTVFAVNWNAPNDGQVILQRGFLGPFTRNTDGLYTTQIRSLTQMLQQNLGTVYGERCDVKRFGDSRCALDITSITRTAVVSAIVDRQNFTITLTPSTAPPIPAYFDNGVARFTGTGAATGFERDMKSTSFSAGSLTVQLFEELPVDLQIGDTLEVEPGCDRTLANCTVHDNVINMHAYGLLIPGIDALMAGPTGGSST